MSDPNSDNYIPDGSIQASSEISSSNHKASYGRLNGNNQWIAATSDNVPWIQADIGRLVNMYGIQTQGRSSSYWVTTLKVSTFQHVPVAGDNGDSVRDGGNGIKVCNE